MRRLLRVLSLFLAMSSAAAADQVLLYDLTMNGAVVGKREVKIRYLPPEEGQIYETRIIESWTELDTRIKGLPFTVKNRSTALASVTDSSFTSSMSINGAVRQVQGRIVEEGRWQVNAIIDNQMQNWNLRRTEVDVSSLDLLDPQRSRIFTTSSPARVFIAETGDLLTGPVEDLGEVTLDSGGQPVLVHRWGWNTEDGRFEMGWTEEGILVDFVIQVQGQELVGKLRNLPEPRSFGEVAPLTELPTFSEEEL